MIEVTSALIELIGLAIFGFMAHAERHPIMWLVTAVSSFFIGLSWFGAAPGVLTMASAICFFVFAFACFERAYQSMFKRDKD